MKKQWNKEQCFQEAQKCKTKREFREKYPAAYYAACRNGWLSEYHFLTSEVKAFIRRSSEYWSKDRCEKISLRFKSIKEFSEKEHSAYNIALHNGWVKDFNWLKEQPNDFKRTIYAYVFEKQRAAYIGVTNNVTRRHKEHLIASEKYDVVIRFCKQHNVDIPDITILENDISYIESIEKEKFYIDKYKNSGYQIINKIRLSSNNKWTYEACYAEAQKYKYAKDFQKSRSAYNCARKNGWLKEFTWLNKFRRDKYWNKETCELEAKKYSSRNEFRINAGAAYHYALINGWINNYTWFIRPTVWNKGKTTKH